MIRPRGVIPILLVVLLVLFGTALQIVRGPAAAPRAAAPAGLAPIGATPTPSPPANSAREVREAVAAVQHAFNAGDVRLLCRSGALVDSAVIRRQNRQSGGCESELELLMAHEPPMRLTVRRLALRRDLATATVTTASGAGVQIDLVRKGRRWLLSFSRGSDPMPALAGIV
jgi:hypothetical protein